MYAALKAKNIPCALKIYAGEQHGFRKAENIQVRSCILFGLLTLPPSVQQWLHGDSQMDAFLLYHLAKDALNAELYFYGRVFGFSPSGAYEGFPIDNLD